MNKEMHFDKCLNIVLFRVAESVTEPGLSRRWASGRKDMLGSLPDISAVYRQEQPTPIPRHEMQVISQQKRDELQMLIEREEERRRRAVVLRLGDLKVSYCMRCWAFSLIACQSRTHHDD